MTTSTEPIIKMPFDGSLPDIFWHYTSMSNFVQIIHSQILRSSFYGVTNDNKECELLQELFLGYLYNRSDLDFELKTLYVSRFNEAFSYFRDLLSKLKPFCITSFSKIGDDISQWERYANDCTGVCLGFSSKSFKQHTYQGVQEQNPLEHLGNYSLDLNKTLWYMRQVIYSTQEAKTIIFDSLYDYLKPILGSQDPILSPHTDRTLQVESEYINSDLAHVMRDFYLCNSIFKHHGFISEKEYRFLVQAPFNLITAELSNDRLKMFCEFLTLKEIEDSPDLPVKMKIDLRCVVLGPKNTNSKNAVELFLAMNGLYAVNVQNSIVPYR